MQGVVRDGHRPANDGADRHGATSARTHEAARGCQRPVSRPEEGPDRLTLREPVWTPRQVAHFGRGIKTETLEKVDARSAGVTRRRPDSAQLVAGPVDDPP